jgi:hypothetical protein
MEDIMRKRLISISALVLAVVSISVGAMTAFQPAVAGGTTCLTKHCPNNTHCCIGCTSNPICVRNGVPCPECAPQ